MLDVIKKLNFLLTKRDKQFLIGLVFFSIFVAMVETVGVSAIMPFIAVASDFTLIETNEYYRFVYDLFGFSDSVAFVMAFGIVLILFYVLRGAVNLLYFYLLSRFSSGRYHLVAYRLYENYLGMPYKKFVGKNSSFLTKSIVTEANSAIILVKNFLMILSEVFVIIFIYGMLIFANWKVTLLLTVILLLKVVFLSKTISLRIKREGSVRAETQKNLFEVINSTFGNFKLIKLMNNEQDLQNKFKSASFGFATSQIRYQTFGAVPRIFLEVIGFSLIVAIVVYFLYKYGKDISVIIPLLSIYVLALYRLMPSVNRIMTAYNGIIFNQKALDIVHGDLTYESEVLGNKDLHFNSSIKTEDLEFGYGEKPIIDGVSIEIKKGERVAFIGESGSGKSTFVDLLIGLYRPESGSVVVDNTQLCDENIRSWREKIGYIPQDVYLFDGTVGANVAFSKDYDKEKVVQCLKKANIYHFINEKEGLDTKVGEDGIMLSGGQKQRIAIARALYGNPEVLVLDEATSALDSETEEKIMEEIYGLSKDLTLIIIAHRLSTLKGCDRIYKIEDGKVFDKTAV